MEDRSISVRSSNENGFTIIEILIAVAIFSIGMLGIAGMQIQATKSNLTARSSTDLTAYATDQLEALTRLPYDASGLDTGTTHTSGSGRFTASWTVEEDDIVDNTKTLILVAQEILRGNTRTLTLRYIIPEM